MYNNSNSIKIFSYYLLALSLVNFIMLAFYRHQLLEYEEALLHNSDIDNTPHNMPEQPDKIITDKLFRQLIPANTLLFCCGTICIKKYYNSESEIENRNSFSN